VGIENMRKCDNEELRKGGYYSLPLERGGQEGLIINHP
jgi:hypothetical protein